MALECPLIALHLSTDDEVINYSYYKIHVFVSTSKSKGNFDWYFVLFPKNKVFCVSVYLWGLNVSNKIFGILFIKYIVSLEINFPAFEKLLAQKLHQTSHSFRKSQWLGLFIMFIFYYFDIVLFIFCNVEITIIAYFLHLCWDG